MVTTSNSIAIETLNQRIANLTQQWTEVNKQIDTEGDYEKRLLLQRRADDLWADVEKLEAKLKQQDQSESNARQADLDFQQNIPEIDFKEAIEIVRKITKQFGRDGGSALFLLEDSYSMAGNILILKIQEELKRKTRSFRHIKVELSSSGTYDEYGLLQRLAGYLNFQCKSVQNIQEYTREIINKICQSLQSGSVVFIEINKWDCLQYPERIIPWFVDEFWIPLIQESQVLIQRERLTQVKFLAVIDSEAELEPDCKTLPYYCCQDNFDSKKILRLPLGEWNEEDIVNWLDIYSGLTGTENDLIASRIYRITKGTPLMVYGKLQAELSL